MGNLAKLVGAVALSMGLSYLPVHKLDMAVIPKYDIDGNPAITILKEPGEDINNVPDKSLEEYVMSIGGTPQMAKDAVEGKYAAQRAEEWDIDFYDSGKYGFFSDWCEKNGLNPPERAEGYGATSGKGENAFALPELGVIGINTYSEDILERVAEESRYTVDPINQVLEEWYTHEYGHLAQDLAKYEGNPELMDSERCLVEAKNEMALSKFFYYKTINSSDETEERYNAEIMNNCLNRYLGMYVNYLKEQGEDIEVNEETVKDMLSEFAEYVGENPPNLEGKIVKGDFGGTSDTGDAENPEAEDGVLEEAA